MHANNIVHRDLKPENVLLERNKDYYMIKLIDFGTAYMRAPGEEYLRDRIGTPYYIAPEVLSTKYDEKCDLWSLGVICFQLLSGFKPFEGKTDQDVFKEIKRAMPKYTDDKGWEGISDEAREFT
jgi:calcium-dependent protein kinase